MRRILTIGALLCLLPLMRQGLQARSQALTEYDVKAAYLFNFAKFVEWPDAAAQKAGESFAIGILGRDPFGEELKNQFNGKVIQGRRLVFRRLHDVQQAAGCQIVFVAASEARHWASIASALRNYPVLTVSDMARFADRGGMIGFTLEQSRVRFDINVAAAEQAELKISSQLLKLARTVESAEGGRGE